MGRAYFINDVRAEVPNLDQNQAIHLEYLQQLNNNVRVPIQIVTQEDFQSPIMFVCQFKTVGSPLM